MTSTRSFAITSLVGAFALVAAFLVVAHPVAAVVLSLVSIAVAVLALGNHAPLTRVVVIATLGTSATIDLIRRLNLGPTTAYAWLTGAIALSAAMVGLIVWTTSLAATARRALLFMLFFPIWAIASAAWAPPNTAGAQNLLVYVAAPAIAVVSASAVATAAVPFVMLRVALFWTFSIGSGLYAASLLLDGPGGGAVVGARSYALFAAVGVAWTAALARHGCRPEFRFAIVMLVLTFLSLSRTGFVVALIVFLAAQVSFNSVRNLGRTLALLGAVAVAALIVVNYANPFASRFAEPDVVALPGGIHLSVSGRGKLWHATWDSALHSPIIGQGAGSADVVAASVDPNAGHPHNDYLRVFHDFGLVGAGLLALALGVPLLSAAGRLRQTAAEHATRQAVHRAATLAIAALSLEILTDNSLVYGFVVIPLAVVVGASLGTEAPCDSGPSGHTAAPA